MRNTICAIMIISLIFGTTGCNGNNAVDSAALVEASTTENGVSLDEYNAIVSERDSLLARVEELEDIAAALPVSTPIPTAQLTAKTDFNEDLVLEQLEIVQYEYTNMIKTPWVFLSIKNNSEYDLNISVDLRTFDENNSIIGAKNEEESAFESGTEIAIGFALDESYSSMEYDIAVAEEDYFECAVSDLSYETNSAEEKEIVSVTNNGENAIEAVECTILFFNGSVLVDHDTAYFIDDDFELKSGKTIIKELDCSEPYDSIKVFFTGRR